MKRLNKFYALLAGLTLVLAGCGGGGSVQENEFLGTLPGMAANYDTQLEDLKTKAKESTSMDDAFKYDKEYDLLKEEADKKIEEAFATTNFEKGIPFQGLDSDRFTVETLTATGAGRTRLNLEATVKAKEDLKNEYGGWEKYIFGYIAAVDAQGAFLGEPTVLASAMGARPEYKGGDEIKLTGSIGPLKDFVNFAAINLSAKKNTNQRSNLVLKMSVLNSMHSFYFV